MVALQAALGLLVFPLIAWALAERREWRPAVVGRLAVGGIAFQLVVAGLLLKVPVSRDAFLVLNDAVVALRDATLAGTSFVFGYVGGGGLPFEEPYPGASFVLAFQALPIILVMSALSAVLWHLGILPALIRGFAALLERSLGVGGSLGLGAAANIFVGMVEAPLLIRPVLRSMSRSDLFTLMTCGMATIAGTVLVLYAQFLDGVVEGALGHILTASVISAPAAILMGRLMVPPADEGEASAPAAELPPSQDGSVMAAITRGTAEGVQLLIHVTAMLLVLVALVALVNAGLGLISVGDAPLTLQRMAGWIFAPIAWLMGVPWSEAATAGALLGTKTILNELLAYLELAKLPAGALSERSRVILTYALCGFANFGSLGIMIGGLVSMAPERRDEVVALGPRTILSGTLATCMTGAIVGLIGT